MTMNTLFYGDNLRILRDEIASASIDLIYLDPPFNSNRNYNVLFKEKSGNDSTSQIRAFTDTWTWDESARDAYQELVRTAPENVSRMIEAMKTFIGQNDMMAYLVMMTQRLLELHRVLKPTGSIYLHCDPTASHYLKVVMDTIFGVKNYRSEVIWKRTSSHSDAGAFGSVHDSILFYGRTPAATWNNTYQPYSAEYIEQRYKHKDPDGRRYMDDNVTAMGLSGGGYSYNWKGKHAVFRVPLSTMERLEAENRLYYTRTGSVRIKRYLDEAKGIPVQDVITDIPPINSQAAERLGYPTQKPVALLERIINASSNRGDVVLDPFCGCGTAVVAAEKLGRQWIGIDITHLSVALMQNRLRDMFGERVAFEVRGTPSDVGAARMLAEQDRYEFQYWANSLVQAQPLDGRDKKGADRGIDGVIRFFDDRGEKVRRVIVQVKSGHVSAATIRDLIGTQQREKAEMSMLITLEPPTRPMREEAVEAGSYHSIDMNKAYPACQIITIQQLLEGREPRIPPAHATFERAPREKMATHRQAGLLDER